MTKKKPELQEELQPEELQPEDQAGIDEVSLEEQLAQAIQQRDEYLQMAQRVQADFDNFRRRNRQVAAESFDDGARAFIKTLLPVMDNLERALQENREGDPLYTGVQLVARMLMDTLAARGISVISRVGEPFDPNLGMQSPRPSPKTARRGQSARSFSKDTKWVIQSCGMRWCASFRADTINHTEITNR